MVGLLALVVGFTGPAENKVTITPWCDNSMRVRISPATLPAGAQAAQAALSKTLADKNMTDLAGAMIDACGTGVPMAVKAGQNPIQHGNLVAS